MAIFNYKAVDKQGFAIDGVFEAADTKTAIAALAHKDLFVTQISKAQDKISTKKLFDKITPRKIKPKDILAFTTQLSTAVGAGLGILDAIEVISKQQKNENIKTLFNQITMSIKTGESLSQALEAHPDIFDELYISMVRSGETAGILDKTLSELSELLGRSEQIKTRIKNASIYPITVLVVGLISIAIVIRFVMPKILATITETGMMLPLPTKILLNISDILESYSGVIVIAIGLAVFSFIKYKNSSTGRVAIDALKLRMPYFGSLTRSIAIGRFTKTLGALLSSGITILDALKVVRDTLGNLVLSNEMTEVAEKIRTGSSLADALEDSDLFPPLLTQIVSVGEHTGKLDEMLLGATKTFDAEADSKLERFMAIFPVLLILLLGLIVLFLVMATLMPILMMSMGSGVV